MADLIAIRRGLLGPAADRWFWRDKAERRVRALEDDEPEFGLVPAEIAELAELKQILADAGQQEGVAQGAGETAAGRLFDDIPHDGSPS